MVRDYLILLSWLCTVHGKIGYFWHISDLHYDPKYMAYENSDNMCGNMRHNMDSGHIRLDKRLAGTFGNYSCDSPWALIESAASAMRAKHSHGNHADGIEFVLWTGDALSHGAEMSDELRLQCLKNLTDLLSQTFTGPFILPGLGHEDISLNFTQLASLWKHWLPEEALATFKKTGYYTIEQTKKNYRIIILNTNLWMNIDPTISSNRVPQRASSREFENSDDPLGQWAWFEKELSTARVKKQTVYIVGHTPPGVDEREAPATGFIDKHNAKYIKLVQQQADIIGGQFFGHWHSDTFRVIYNDNGVPVSWLMVAPSVTPYRSGGPNNPGLRLYEFDTETGKLLDYTQLYLDLPEANSAGQASWKIEYTLKDYYNLKEISALTLHDLADRFTQSNDYALVRYYAANTVALPREVEQIWGCGGALNGACALHHYCAVTRLNQVSFNECFSSYAFALAASALPSSQVHTPTLFLLAALLLIQILITR